MISEKKSYVYRLMKVTCSCGVKAGEGFWGSIQFWNPDRADFEQNLNAKHDHGVYFHDFDSPLLNANDHIKDENISTMGRCRSPWNPRGLLLTVSLFAPLIPGAHLLSAGLGLALRSQLGCVCEPVTMVPWVYVDDDYFIDGAPALTIESELPCFWGGTIKIVAKREDADSAQATAESEASSSDSASSADGGEGGEGGGAAPADVDRRTLLPSEVQEKIDSFCDSEMTNPTSKADEELANDTPDLHERITTGCCDCISTYRFNIIGDFDIDVTVPWDNGIRVSGVEHDETMRHVPTRLADPDIVWENRR